MTGIDIILIGVALVEFVIIFFCISKKDESTVKLFELAIKHDQDMAVSENVDVSNIEIKLRKEAKEEARWTRDKIKLIEFKMDNPAKYKIGDKSEKNFVVTNVEVGNYNALDWNGVCSSLTWKYTMVNIKTGKTEIKY